MFGQLYGSAKTCNTCSDNNEICAQTLKREGDAPMVQRDHMPVFEVRTGQHTYQNVVERGVLRRASEYLPTNAGKRFVVTTEDVWQFHGQTLQTQFQDGKFETLFFPGGEANKRLSAVEALADQMIARGGDRTSIVVGFGGGIVTDVGGF